MSKVLILLIFLAAAAAGIGWSLVRRRRRQKAVLREEKWRLRSRDNDEAWERMLREREARRPELGRG